MKIVVSQSGGIGNQLFQYAAGKSLAKKYAASLRIATLKSDAQNSFGSPRPVQLSQFALTEEIAQQSKFDRIVLSMRPRLAPLIRILSTAMQVQVIRQPVDRAFVYDNLEVKPNSRLVYLVGWWQAYRYVQPVENDLRKEFIFVHPPTAKNADVARQISAASNAVSIHVRRGDFVTVFGAGVMLPLDYYERAMQRMTEMFDECTFFIFSDDLPFVRDWVRGKKNVVVVDHNDAWSGHEDMRLMALCRHHIIANSSFSWWGAWLNPKTDKCVIAPSKWLIFDNKPPEILPPEWHVMEC